MEKGSGTFKILTDNKSWRRWEDNIKLDLKQIGINTTNWIDLAQSRNY